MVASNRAKSSGGLGTASDGSGGMCGVEIDHAHRTGRRRDGIASLDDLGTDEGQIEQHLIELALLTLEARHLRGGG